jgi:hypothetical protein
MDQIVRGIHVVNGTAKPCISLMIHGAVEVDAAVSPGVSFHVGDENVTVQYGIVGVFKVHGTGLLFGNRITWMIVMVQIGVYRPGALPLDPA